MDTNTTPFNLTIFTNVTKKVCLCSVTAIIIIVIFIITPFSHYSKTSIFMRILAILILFYTVYLNILQTNSLNKANSAAYSEELKSQLNMNVICSYVFTFFIAILIVFVIKSFF